uniref:Uncharacterized protein n=1 Tax=Anopheles coluzzii TaxID=1518534 RepID=A0A8W7PT94_ANOCL
MSGLITPPHGQVAVRDLALQTVVGVECAVRLHYLILRNASDTFQRVNVLRVVAHQQTLLLEQPDEVVRRCRFERARVELLGEREERFRVLVQILQLKDGLRCFSTPSMSTVSSTRRRAAPPEPFSFSNPSPCWKSGNAPTAAAAATSGPTAPFTIEAGGDGPSGVMVGSDAGSVSATDTPAIADAVDAAAAAAASVAVAAVLPSA